MIISTRHNYIFVHIPKTGGTSVALALEETVGEGDILLGDTPVARKRRKTVDKSKAAGKLWKHATLRDIAGLVDDKMIESATVFTIVRNPWDRLLSYYTWLRAQKFKHPAVALAQSVTFSVFLNHPGTIASFRNGPCTSYVTDRFGQDRCAHYLRFETLEADFAALATTLGLTTGPLPHVNRSDRGSYRDAYSDADRALVAEITASDIARFGYTF